MGTRADFYVGRGEKAEYLGSIAYDGYPDNDTLHRAFRAKTEKTYRARVAEVLAREDGSVAGKDPWPWPWKDSRLTDYAYTFDPKKKRVYGSCFGNKLAAIVRKRKGKNVIVTELPYDEHKSYHEMPIEEAPVKWPVLGRDFSMGAPAGSAKSGVMLITSK